ncbi:hypothetical protein Bca4012_098807 [Brassica carinata]
MNSKLRPCWRSPLNRHSELGSYQLNAKAHTSPSSPVGYRSNGFPTKLVSKLPHKTFHHEFVVLTPKPSRRNRAKQHLQEHEFQFFRNEERTGSDAETNRSSSTNTCKRTLKLGGERQRHILDIYGGTRSDKGKIAPSKIQP